jgi:hypothetical protein
MFKKLLFAKKYTAKLSILLLVSVLMFSIIASTARAEVVYFDDFDGPAGTNLNGTKPDITPGGETWQAGQYVDACRSLRNLARYMNCPLRLTTPVTGWLSVFWELQSILKPEFSITV